jgi:hypothetical protein
MTQIQRITDGLEGFNDSHLPGLFPIHVDASGCKAQIHFSNPYEHLVDDPTSEEQAVEEPPRQGNAQPDDISRSQDTNDQAGQVSHTGAREETKIDHIPHENVDPGDSRRHLSKRQDLEDTSRAEMGNAMRESLNTETSHNGGHKVETIECIPQGLVPSIRIPPPLSHDFTFY